jgi:hypothetical protein
VLNGGRLKRRTDVLYEQCTEDVIMTDVYITTIRTPLRTNIYCELGSVKYPPHHMFPPSTCAAASRLIDHWLPPINHQMEGLIW